MKRGIEIVKREGFGYVLGNQEFVVYLSMIVLHGWFIHQP